MPGIELGLFISDDPRLSWPVSRNPTVDWASGTMTVTGKELKAVSTDAACDFTVQI